MEIIGNRGTIVYNGGATIDVRRIDPAVELKNLKPHPENPPLKYGNFDEKLYFVEEKFQIPEQPVQPLWVHLWDSVVNNVPFPITPAQAMAVVQVTETCSIILLSRFEVKNDKIHKT